MLQPLLDAWPWIASSLATGLAIVASGHAVLFKRDPRSAIGWVGLIWFVPYIGVVMYFLFGINRIQRRGGRRRPPRAPGEARANTAPPPPAPPPPAPRRDSPPPPPPPP